MYIAFQNNFDKNSYYQIFRSLSKFDLAIYILFRSLNYQAIYTYIKKTCVVENLHLKASIV